MRLRETDIQAVRKRERDTHTHRGMQRQRQKDRERDLQNEMWLVGERCPFGQTDRETDMCLSN